MEANQRLISTPQRIRDQIKAWFLNPWWTVVTTLIAVITIPLSFYLAQDKEPNITYTINPVRSQLVQVDKTSDFAVSFRGQRVTADVSSATVSIWNSGKKAVARSDVLSPIEIKVGDGTRILDSKIVSWTREVIKPSIGTSELPRGLSGVNFHILEHNDGLQIQLIYEGNIATPIIVAGIVEGQPHGISYFDSQGHSGFLKQEIWMLLAIAAINLLSVSSSADKLLGTKYVRLALILTAVLGVAVVLFVIFNLAYPSLIGPPSFSPVSIGAAQTAEGSDKSAGSGLTSN
jgi:hypothetical protein